MASVLRSQVAEFADVLTSSNIAQFLATRHWTVHDDRGFAQTWVSPDGSVPSVLIPRDESFVDFQRRLQEAAVSIGDIYGWGASEVAEQVAAVKADLLFVRVDQHSADGTIPLRQAAGLLENVDQMMRAAAIVAYNPHSSGLGRLPSSVQDFLTDDLRMGHTKKGSFIITVAARLDEVDAVSAASAAPAATPSFSRQVMTTLSAGLSATKAHVDSDPDARPALEDTVARGVRLPLVQALEDAGDAEGLRSLDLEFEWAPVEPIQGNVERKITFDRAEIDALPELRERLTQKSVPQQETLVGPVVELRRAETDNADSGEVVLRAEVNGRLVRVTVPLSGSDYDWAIRAHQEHLPFTVSGELGRHGNSWRLLSDVEVDRAFLEHFFARRT